MAKQTTSQSLTLDANLKYVKSAAKATIDFRLGVLAGMAHQYDQNKIGIPKEQYIELLKSNLNF